jgi:hypothetical protein
MATALDEALIGRLSKCLCFTPNETQIDHIFRFEGPLGSFSARMELACLFGFIDNATYEQLDIFRELRNACAHSKHDIAFSDPSFANVTKRLFQPLGYMAVPTDAASFKVAIMIETIFLLNTLGEGSREKGAIAALAALKEIVARLPSRGTPP